MYNTYVHQTSLHLSRWNLLRFLTWRSIILIASDCTIFWFFLNVVTLLASLIKGTNGLCLQYTHLIRLFKQSTGPHYANARKILSYHSKFIFTDDILFKYECLLITKLWKLPPDVPLSYLSRKRYRIKKTYLIPKLDVKTKVNVKVLMVIIMKYTIWLPRLPPIVLKCDTRVVYDSMIVGVHHNHCEWN